MKRILVIGCGGSGKSTFARKLNENLSIELIHLDRLFWQPNWVESEKSRWESTVRSVAEKDSWIIDGNYDGTMRLRMERADTLFYFDIPRVVCVLNALKRSVAGMAFKEKRNDMADGCSERIDFEFYRWIWNFNRLNRKKYMQMFAEMKDKKRIFIIKSYRDSKRFLERLEKQRKTRHNIPS